MSYSIEFKPSAAAQWRKLSPSVQKRLAPKITALALNPRPVGVKQLQGEDRVYRIRAGDYRIVYAINDDVLVVLLLQIGHRKDVYR